MNAGTPVTARVPVGGGAVRALRWGATVGPTVILLHGFGQTADFFAPFAGALLARGAGEVIAPDLRGHGDSDDFAGGLADEVLIADAYAVWRALADRPSIWFGNSLGARVAALACAAHPSVASRLVLGECLLGLERVWTFLLSGARQQSAQRAARFASRDEAALFASRTLRLRGIALELWLDHGLRAQNHGLREKLRTGFLAAERWPARDSAQLERELAALRCPVELIYGGGASALSAPQQEQVRALFPGCTLARLERAGHDLFLDAPDELAEVLLRA